MEVTPIPLSIMKEGSQVQWILKQIQFGVTMSEHAVAIVMDCAGRLSQEHIVQMIDYLKTKLVPAVDEGAKIVEEVAPVAVSVAAVVAPAELPAVTAAAVAVEQTAATVQAVVDTTATQVSAAVAPVAAPVAAVAPAAVA